MTPDQERWAEALAIERLHGTDAYDWTIERAGALLAEGKIDGVLRFQAIADKLALLSSSTARPS